MGEGEGLEAARLVVARVVAHTQAPTRGQRPFDVDLAGEDAQVKRVRARNGDQHMVREDARIEELDFSVRTYNCLKKANIMTIGELVTRTEGDLMQIRNFGKKSLTEVKEKLASLGLGLRRGGASDGFDYADYDEDDESEGGDTVEAGAHDDDTVEEEES